MRKLIAVLVVALMIPSLGHAGTKAHPDVSDPAGDATPGIGAPYADLTGVWLTPTRNSGGALTALQVHFGTAGAPGPNDEAGYQVSWNLDAGQASSCFGSVNVWRTIPKDNEPYIVPEANLTYSCTGDSNTISVGPLTVAVYLDGGHTVGFDSIGAETVITVPLSALQSGGSAGLYRDGARLADLSAEAQVVRGIVATPVDDAGCSGVQVGTDGNDPCTAAYVIGS